MNRRILKKKLDQEVIYDTNGVRNSRRRIVFRFVSFCLKIIGGAVLTPVLLPLSLFRPIEIWYLRSRRPKISLFIEELEWGLRNLQAHERRGKVLVIALYKLPFTNKQLAKMYRRRLILLGKNQLLLGEFLSYVRPIGRIRIKKPIERYAGMFETWNCGSPSLKFTKKEEAKGRKLEEKLFNGESPPFICFAVQSSIYREKIDVAETKFWGPLHEDTFSSIARLENYLPVIRELTCAGIAVVRMGFLEEERLPIGLGPLAIDYAFDFRSEFGDVWLHSKCMFSLVGAAGSHWFGAAFNRPTLLTDAYAIRSTYDNRDLFIPQRGWIPREDRYLTFSEIANSEWARDIELLERIKLLKNTPEEIMDATSEMILRLAGKWIETDEDKELQCKYRSIVNSFPIHQRTPARMGAKFLRENQYLLPQ